MKAEWYQWRCYAVFAAYEEYVANFDELHYPHDDFYNND